MEPLQRLEPGMPIPYGGDRVTRVSESLAAAFRPGDRLIVVQDTGELLHVPAETWELARAAVERAATGFQQLASTADSAITDFYLEFADRIMEETTFGPVRHANRADVASAEARGRSTTRLEMTERLRSDMRAGLEMWAHFEVDREPVEKVAHDGWQVELVPAPVGPIGFVFEGRPNVFADATGVLRTGNSVVFRIGSDALGTARALMEHCLTPAMRRAGLPAGAVTLVDSPAHAAAWAMFSDDRLALAVARGSGSAVAQLGAVARQAGIPVSLHGTGGAWMTISGSASPGAIESVVLSSLDRKVCNTLNTVVVIEEEEGEADPRLGAVFAGLAAAAERREGRAVAHVGPGVAAPAGWEGTVVQIDQGHAGTEWEWENDPEITILTTPSLEEAVALFNRLSPRFVASLISQEPGEHERYFAAVDAPFVGNGFTRWVDGQYAFGRPELGLSTWQHGRLLGRGAVLSGDSVFTLRARATQDRLDLGR